MGTERGTDNSDAHQNVTSTVLLSHPLMVAPLLPAQHPASGGELANQTHTAKPQPTTRPERDDSVFATLLVLIESEEINTFSTTFSDEIPTVNIFSRLKAIGRGKSQDCGSLKLTLHLNHNDRTHY